ncbi:glycosyltransferase family 4 protein [Piscinibacter sp. XHJ-5]|uniref:glycosyltransferase family 4 protein n=1 Tax=Piscinibacter sp. XHJ-5 TaxID=3037797 RepID=UPI0024534E3A|nr:glycosyltransferase family 4 protein [Piscinibacter sp. XHJ-5]
MTRYVNLRKYAERDPDVEFTWVPVSHWAPRETRLAKLIPQPIHLRAAVLRQAWPGLAALSRMDAVMVHLFEAELLALLRGFVRSRPVIVSSTDEAPIGDEASYPLYPRDMLKSRARMRMRLAIDRWRARHVDLLMPFSQWAADIFLAECPVDADKVRPMHVGLDLDQWTPGEPRTEENGRFRILFVGGDFERKGGHLLIDVFQRHLAERAELHLVSNQAPAEVPAHVHVHRNLKPNDPTLIDLYRTCDVFAVPTTADLVPWAYLEAMAMRCPAIGTAVGAIPELIPDGRAGFVIPRNDGQALRAALESLIDDPALRQRMAHEGRQHVEMHYNAAVNVPRILRMMKGLVDNQYVRAARPLQS